MFARVNRLAKTKDVEQVIKRGQSFFSPHFVIKFSKAATQTRLTVVVSTKVSKSAVKRNRIKRVLRSQLQSRLKDLKAGDYAIIVKPLAAKIEAKALREQLSELFVKLKFLNHD